MGSERMTMTQFTLEGLIILPVGDSNKPVVSGLRYADPCGGVGRVQSDEPNDNTMSSL